MNTTPDNFSTKAEFGTSELRKMAEEAIARVVREKSLATENLTEQQATQAIMQAFECGDFRRLVRASDGAQQVVYEPYAEAERLRDYKECLEWLEAQEGLTTCGFKFKWFSDSGITLREAIRERIQSEQTAKTIEQS